jgi:hypothetical protein
MILLLLIGRKFITPVFSPKARVSILVSTLIATLCLQWYVLNYLPLADCLPFKKGNNIAQQMKPPPGSVPDSFAIRFIYEKAGKQYEFAPENLPADFNTYKFIDRKDQLVRKGNAEPAIKGFALTGISGADSTQIILAEPRVLLVFSQNLHSAEWINEMGKAVAAAKAQNIPVYMATPSLPDAMALFQKNNVSGAQFFNCDFTVVRTAARTDPTLFILHNGTIQNKYSSNQFGDVVKDLSSQKF